ncbi:DsbA family protein [Candidatus Schneideria nysicola]|uniref:DsbA family protein n=1 Tax=Candidatus Schneideria nysicola TaxID=1081631 RepID=UPI001CAA5509|nr:DsbA family protein [Candidatus Schneideria nysicola]UAJ65318.1 DsbA family protein [Candidatus Schneideria nysicola]
MKKITIIFLIIIIIFMCSESSSVKVTRGREYVQLHSNPIDKEFPTILVFFSFYCFHCYEMECKYHIFNILQKSLDKDKYYKIIKYHIDFMGPLGSQLTQAWSVAIHLGIDEQIGPLIFRAIQETPSHSIEYIHNILIKHTKMNREEYNSIWNSKKVDDLMYKQRKAVKDLQLRYIPTIFIYGKYMILTEHLDRSSIHTFNNELINIIQFLLKE